MRRLKARQVVKVVALFIPKVWAFPSRKKYFWRLIYLSIEGGFKPKIKATRMKIPLFFLF
jgi:hypothetical protein